MKHVNLNKCEELKFLKNQMRMILEKLDNNEYSQNDLEKLGILNCKILSLIKNFEK